METHVSFPSICNLLLADTCRQFFLLFSAQIKEQLSVDLNVPVWKQELKGWANRKVTDNVSERLYKNDISEIITYSFKNLEEILCSTVSRLSKKLNQ